MANKALKIIDDQIKKEQQEFEEFNNRWLEYDDLDDKEFADRAEAALETLRIVRKRIEEEAR